MTTPGISTNATLCSSVDYAASFHIGGRTFVIIFGWLRMLSNTTLVLAESNGANPAMLKTIFWPRHDVEEIYGPCKPELQRGYGFAGVAECPVETGSSFDLIGIQTSGMRIIQGFQSCHYYSLDKFHDFIFELPIPLSEFTFFFDTLLLDLFKAIDQLQYPAYREEMKFGDVQQMPEISIVSIPNEDPEIFYCQMLALTELATQQTGADVLVLLPNVSQLDRSITVLTQVHALTGMPMRLISLGRKLTPHHILTEAAQAAKGEYLFYFDEAAVPTSTFATDILLQELKHDAAMICWQAKTAITGSITQSRMQYFGLGIVGNKPLQKNLDNFLTYNGAFAIRKQDLAYCATSFLPYAGKNWIFIHLQHRLALLQKKSSKAGCFHEIYSQPLVNSPAGMKEMRLNWFDELAFMHFYKNSATTKSETGRLQ